MPRRSCHPADSTPPRTFGVDTDDRRPWQWSRKSGEARRTSLSLLIPGRVRVVSGSSRIDGRVAVRHSSAMTEHAIERVAEGDAVFSPRLAGFALDAFRGGERVGGDAELDELTQREREVLQLIARGYMYKEIAARLNLSVKTVESHVSSVLRKLQLSSRHELTRWATQHRLV